MGKNMKKKAIKTFTKTAKKPAPRIGKAKRAAKK
jgi:hypothetical protein